MKLEFHIGTKAIIETDLKCSQCGEKTHVLKYELIPECSKCAIHTRWSLQ